MSPLPSPSGSCPDVWSDASCSGRGVCAGPNMCQCTAEGWIGQSDFTYGTPSCSVQQTTVQVLYALLFVACLFEAPLSSFALYRRVSFRVKSAWEAWDIVISVCRCFNLLFLGVMGILRATRPFATIGNDVAVTIMYTLGWPFAAVCGAGFFIRMMLINAEFFTNARIRGRIKFFQRFMIWPLLAPIVGLSSPVFVSMLFVSNYSTRYQLIIVHFVGSAVAFFILVTPIILYVYNPFIDAVFHSLNVRSTQANRAKDDSTTVVLQNLLVKYRRIRAGFIGFVVYSVLIGVPFGLVPVLNRAGASYYIPVQMISWEILCIMSTVSRLSESEIVHAPLIVRVVYGMAALGSKRSVNLKASGTQTQLSSLAKLPQA